MKTISILFLCALIGLTVAHSEIHLLENHEVDDHFAFSFKIGLKPQNLDTLDSLFWEISNPKSPFYGKFLNNEQIADLISLPEEEIQAVEDYLTAKSGEICNVYVTRSIHRDYLYVDTCAGQAQLLFPNLKLQVFQARHEKILRSAIEMDIKYNLYLLGVPSAIHQHIDAIHDVTDMPVLVKPDLAFNPSSPWLSTDKELDIPTMVEYFGITYDGVNTSTFDADDGQVRGAVVEFAGNSFSASELKSFQGKYGVPSNPIRKVINTEESTEESTEASLDVQTLTSIAQDAHVWEFVFGQSLDFITVVEKFMTTEDAPKVISVSYSEPETIFGESKVVTNNTSLMKLGLAGFTFFGSSGDSGPILNPDNCSIFDAEFPATSPYIVAVGGTKIVAATGEQGAWVHSGGGFSVYNKRPAFQDDIVGAYVQSASLPTNSNGAKYNSANRAYPDVSAFGAFEPVLSQGSYQPVGGTSGSCPQFAAIVLLINAQRYQNGLGPLGALNQTLYGLEDGIGRDVTSGQSYATSRYGCTGQYLSGFEAVEGYDAATGLGSPKFDTLLNQLVSIQAPSSSSSSSSDVVTKKTKKSKGLKELLTEN